MSTQEQARKLMVQERKQEEHVEETMLTRAAEEAAEAPAGEVSEKARQLAAQERQEAERLQETMLTRAEEAIHPQSMTTSTSSPKSS